MGHKATARVRKQPETLRLVRVTPSLRVNDLTTSLAWYREVLGFVVADQWEYDGSLGGAVLRAGTVELVLNQDDVQEHGDRAKGEGVRLYCTTRQELEALAQWIQGRGGRLDYEPKVQPWGSREFGITDPDGYKITIAAHAPR